MKRSWFLILVALAVVLGYSTADARVNWRNYYTWEVVFKATDGTERTKLSIGASERATDGYDAVYEVDEYRAGIFRTYFYHPEWGRGSVAGGTDYYWSDIRSENLPQTWDLTVQANRTGRNITLNWNLAHLENDGCSTIDLTLVDTQGGNSVDITGGGANSYEYYNNSTAPRHFTITASGGVGTSGEATYYADGDGDNYGDAGNSTVNCELPSGYVTDSTDCDDADGSAYPGATEFCGDGIDSDCDTIPDNSDPDCEVAPTPTGTDVSVEPVDSTTGSSTPVDITFDNVTEGGETTVTSNYTEMVAPTGFKLGNPPVYYDVSTTATFDGQALICIDYGGVSFDNESSLRLFHHEDGVWADVTCTAGVDNCPDQNPDTANDVICGLVTSLSPFILAELIPDTDGDGVDDLSDNCPDTPNTGQLDTDGDDIGDACDPDIDGDGFTSDVDCNDTDPAVGAFLFGDFQQPINPDGSSIFKVGRTIPVKLAVTDCAGVSVSNAVVTLSVSEEVNESEASGEASTDSLFRYDDSGEQYVYNLGTSGLAANKKYRATATLQNGQSHSVVFSFE